MKRFRKIALISILFVLFMTLNVYAATMGITLKSSSNSIKAGETVSVTFVANSENGIGGIDGILKYDNTKLQMLTEEGKAAASGFMDCSGVDDASGEYKLSVLYNGDENGTVELEYAKIEFKVLENVSVNEELIIKLSGIEMGDLNENWQTIRDTEIKLTVAGTTTPDNPTPDNPTPDNPTPDNPTPDNPTPDKPNKDDNTIADKEFNYAGKTYMFVGIFIIVIMAIGIYRKINQYKDIK